MATKVTIFLSLLYGSALCFQELVLPFVSSICLLVSWVYESVIRHPR